MERRSVKITDLIALKDCNIVNFPFRCSLDGEKFGTCDGHQVNQAPFGEA